MANITLGTLRDYWKRVYDWIGAGANPSVSVTSMPSVSASISQVVRVTDTVSDMNIYGASWDKAATPSLTRIGKAAGMIAGAGVDFSFPVNNFDQAPIWGEITEVVDTLGNVFIRIPKVYIRKLDGAGFRALQVSKHRHPGFYLPACFWNFTTSAELPYVDVGKYKATKDGANKLESKPNLYPLINTHIVDFRTFARNNNTGGLLGYQQMDIHIVDLLQTLFYIEFATLHSQSVMAGYTEGRYLATHVATVAENGVNRIIVVNAHADLYRVGQAISVGTTLGGNQVFYGRTITAIDVYDGSNKAISFDGAAVNIAVNDVLYNTGWRNGFSSAIAASSGSLVSNSDGKYPCTYRGIESPWGDIAQWVDGVNINERQAWVTPNAADYASNVFASPYLQLSYANGSMDGWVTTVGYDAAYPYAAFPAAVGGSSTTFYCDSYWLATGQIVARYGGALETGVSAGVSTWRCTMTSGGTSLMVGGRLVKKAL